MTMIEPASGEPVEIHERRYMSVKEKIARWREVDERCTICHEPCDPLNGVIWDHRIPLKMGGTNDLSNMEPNHADKCAALKTAKDAADLAEAKRREAKNNGTFPKGQRIRSRPFQTRRAIP